MATQKVSKRELIIKWAGSDVTSLDRVQRTQHPHLVTFQRNLKSSQNVSKNAKLR